MNLEQESSVEHTLMSRKGCRLQLCGIYVGEPLWVDIEETGHTRQAKYEQKKLYPGVTTSDLFKTPKPERVIKRSMIFPLRKEISFLISSEEVVRRPL